MRSLTLKTRVGLNSHNRWAHFSAVHTDGRRHSWCTHMFGQVGAFGVHVVPAGEQAERKQHSQFENHWATSKDPASDGSGRSKRTKDQTGCASLCLVAKQGRRLIESFFFFFSTSRLLRAACPGMICMWIRGDQCEQSGSVRDGGRLNVDWRDTSCRSTSDASKTERFMMATLFFFSTAASEVFTNTTNWQDCQLPHVHHLSLGHFLLLCQLQY